jgi:hypothetical protein
MNKFISEVQTRIKDIDPTVKFGVSPSGVWRNKGSDPDGSDTRGLAHYDYLYADVLKWLKNDWIDYVTPQIYWNIGHKYADYETLVEWWSKHTYGKHLYIGQGVYMARNDAVSSAWQKSSQLPDQTRFNHQFENVRGTIFYKASAVKRNPLGFNDSLKVNFFAEAAVPPKMDWLPELVAIDVASIDEVVTVILADIKAPPSPENLTALKMGKYYMLSWKEPQVSGKNFDDKAISYTIYRFRGLYPGHLSEKAIYNTSDDTDFFIIRKRFALFKKPYTFVVTATDKAGNESLFSESVTIKMKP